MLDKIIEKLSKMFKDNEGKVSQMRILSAFAVVVPIVVWTIYVFTNEWTDFNESFAILILGALGSKAAQKYAEVKKENKELPKFPSNNKKEE
jgi:uncharacterized membrane protein YiaA